MLGLFKTSSVLSQFAMWARRRSVPRPVGRWVVGDGPGNAFRRADQGSWDNGAVAHRWQNQFVPRYKATELGRFDTGR